jgi:hypothetical protein
VRLRSEVAVGTPGDKIEATAARSAETRQFFTTSHRLPAEALTGGSLCSPFGRRPAFFASRSLTPYAEGGSRPSSHRPRRGGRVLFAQARRAGLYVVGNVRGGIGANVTTGEDEAD